MKLTPEQQKEFQDENYRMMATVSGKSFTDLTGQPPTRADYPENYCLIKQMFLKNCVEDISSRQLFETLKNQGYPAKYSTFKGLVSYYVKMGYLYKSNSKKPFTYKMTDLGYQHSKNPYMAVDEISQKRMRFIYSEIEKLLINHPEIAKSMAEVILGHNLGSPNISGGIVNNLSQFSNNDYGSVEELKQDIESKIYDKEFLKDADINKINALATILADGSLTLEERQDYIADTISEALNANKGGMTLKTTIYQTKPEGARNYYPILISAMNQKVTKSLYDALPFRFIEMKLTKEVRLEAISHAGKSRNDGDSTEIPFDRVNAEQFNNQMTIKTNPNNEKQEIDFYYVGSKWNYKITTMSFNDYRKTSTTSKQPQMRINTKSD